MNDSSFKKDINELFSAVEPERMNALKNERFTGGDIDIVKGAELTEDKTEWDDLPLNAADTFLETTRDPTEFSTDDANDVQMGIDISKEFNCDVEPAVRIDLILMADVENVEDVEVDIELELAEKDTDDETGGECVSRRDDKAADCNSIDDKDP